MKLFGYSITIVKDCELIDFLEEMILLDQGQQDLVLELYTALYNARKPGSNIEYEIMKAHFALLDPAGQEKMEAIFEEASARSNNYWKKLSNSYSRSFKTMTTRDEKAMLSVADIFGPIYETDGEMPNLDRLLIAFVNFLTPSDRCTLVRYAKDLRFSK